MKIINKLFFWTLFLLLCSTNIYANHYNVWNFDDIIDIIKTNEDTVYIDVKEDIKTNWKELSSIDIWASKIIINWNNHNIDKLILQNEWLLENLVINNLNIETIIVNDIDNIEINESKISEISLTNIYNDINIIASTITKNFKSNDIWWNINSNNSTYSWNILADSFFNFTSNYDSFLSVSLNFQWENVEINKSKKFTNIKSYVESNLNSFSLNEIENIVNATLTIEWDIKISNINKASLLNLILNGDIILENLPYVFNSEFNLKGYTQIKNIKTNSSSFLLNSVVNSLIDNLEWIQTTFTLNNSELTINNSKLSSNNKLYAFSIWAENDLKLSNVEISSYSTWFYITNKNNNIHILRSILSENDLLTNWYSSWNTFIDIVNSIIINNGYLFNNNFNFSLKNNLFIKNNKYWYSNKITFNNNIFYKDVFWKVEDYQNNLFVWYNKWVKWNTYLDNILFAWYTPNKIIDKIKATDFKLKTQNILQWITPKARAEGIWANIGEINIETTPASNEAPIRQLLTNNIPENNSNSNFSAQENILSQETISEEEKENQENNTEEKEEEIVQDNKSNNEEIIQNKVINQTKEFIEENNSNSDETNKNTNNYKEILLFIWILIIISFSTWVFVLFFQKKIIKKTNIKKELKKNFKKRKNNNKIFFEKNILKIYNNMLETYNCNPTFLNNFLHTLKTRNFVILLWWNGVWKTAFVESLVRWIYKENSKTYFKKIIIKWDYTNSRSFMWLYDKINNNYIDPNWVTRFITKAYNDRNNPYFLLLDEINIANIEDYFPEIIEIDKIRKNWNSLLNWVFDISKNEKNQIINNKLWFINDYEFEVETENNINKVWYKIPDNLFIIWTANIDKAVEPFTWKILDRADVILVEKMNWTDYSNESKRYSNLDINLLEKTILDNSYDDFIVELWKVWSFSDRIKNSILEYLSSTKEEDKYNNIIFQKILPRVFWEDKRQDLENLLDFCIENNEKYNLEKSIDFIKKLKNDDFLSFWKINI